MVFDELHFNPIADDYSSIYSIDKVHILVEYDTETMNRIIEYFKNNPSTKKRWSYTKKYHHFFITKYGKGTIEIFLQKQGKHLKKTTDQFKGEIVFNPNKILGRSEAEFVLKYLLLMSKGYKYNSIDFTIDIPVAMKYVSKKKERTKVTTISYSSQREYEAHGTKGKDGFVKIYDKKKELSKHSEEIDVEELTRIEVTLFHHSIFDAMNSIKEGITPSDGKWLSEIAFGFCGVRIRNPQLTVSSTEKLKDTDVLILDLISEACELGSPTPPEQYISRLGRYKKEKLKPYLKLEPFVVDTKCVEQVITDFVIYMEQLRTEESFHQNERFPTMSYAQNSKEKEYEA